MTCATDVVQSRVMDTKSQTTLKWFLTQLIAIRGHLSLQTPATGVCLGSGKSGKTVFMCDLDCRECRGVVTMNDTDQILADLAEML